MPRYKRSRHLSPSVKTPVTIKVVAAEAQVSTATVSRVLSGLNGVGKAARERVLQTVRRLDYQPNRLARDLRAGLRKVIGVIIPDLQNPFFPGVVHGVEAVLYQAGYTLVLGHSDGVAEREQAHLAMLRGEGAAGVILIPDNGPGADYRALREWKLPVVAVDRAPSGLEVDLVSCNNREGTQRATEHLLQHGYQDIAFINGPENLSVSQERLRGYQDALRAAGITPPAPFVLHSDFRQAGGRSGMQRLLSLAKPPRAVLIGNNLMTLGALEAIYERGWRVPEQVAVVGFDDLPWAGSLRPPLTAVAQPLEEIGRTAARLLLERLQRPDHMVRQVVLPTQLIVRDSCGAHGSSPGESGRRRRPEAKRAASQNGVFVPCEKAPYDQ